MKIGPSFGEELKAAGLLDIPFSWDEKGNITYDKSVTPEQIKAVQAVLDAHDSSKPDPKVAFRDSIRLKLGLTEEEFKELFG